MAINFLSLEKSEIELKQNFVEFLNLCYKMHSKIDEVLKDDEQKKDIIEIMSDFKSKAKEKKRDVRDDCIWILSKDQPRANHLRFIIAILYSIRDLERIAEQCYNIVWYFTNSNMNKSLKKIVTKTISVSKTIFKNMKKIFEEKDVTKHTESVKKYANEFKETYRKTLADAMKNSPDSNEEETEYIYTFSIVMKYIDRTIDHLWSIYENFSMIKNNN